MVGEGQVSYEGGECSVKSSDGGLGTYICCPLSDLQSAPEKLRNTVALTGDGGVICSQKDL